MTSACCEPGTMADRQACPSCGVAGRPLARPTVQALLEPLALRRLRESGLSFCATSTCPVVYFGVDQSFLASDVRVPVWQKEPVGDRMICYCFGENETDIRTEHEIGGVSDAVSCVRQHIAAGRCACEVRNPRGTCCLGDVIAAVKRIQDSVAKAVPR